MEIPRTKFIVRLWPNSAADANPVNIVATVDEYFFKIVSARIIIKLNKKKLVRHDINTTGTLFKNTSKIMLSFIFSYLIIV